MDGIAALLGAGSAISASRSHNVQSLTSTKCSLCHGLVHQAPARLEVGHIKRLKLIWSYRLYHPHRRDAVDLDLVAFGLVAYTERGLELTAMGVQRLSAANRTKQKVLST